MIPAAAKNAYDLAIAYRIYPGVSKVPFLHGDNKLKLAETGVRTLRDSLGNLRAKIYFILDKCPPVYEEMILQYFVEPDVEFIRLKGEGNLATFGKQIDLLLTQTHSEIVFFAEDDYVYSPLLLSSAVSLLNTHAAVDFVTPYDHLDSYVLPIHTRHRYEIMIHGGLHWRTSASTCLTFLTTKKNLRASQKTFRSYCSGNWDSSLWFALTKFNVYNFVAIIRYLFTDTFTFKMIALSWLKNGRQILGGKRYKLWQPIPSIATHMEKISLAPNIDWNKVAALEDIEEVVK
jgi:hypothetical protein